MLLRGLKPDRFGLSCKANKCNDAGAGDLGVLISPGSPVVMPAQPAPGEFRLKFKVVPAPDQLQPIRFLERRNFDPP